MATESDRPQDALTDHEPYRAALSLELRATDRQILASFREAFLRWIASQSSGDFSRAAGLPGKISFEESDCGPGERIAAALVLRIVWPPQQGRALPALHERGVNLTRVDSVVSPHSKPSRQFVFFPDEVVDTAPLYHVRPVHEGTAPVDAIAADRLRRRLQSDYFGLERIRRGGRESLADARPVIRHTVVGMVAHATAAARATRLPELLQRLRPEVAGLRLPVGGHFSAIVGSLLLIVSLAVFATWRQRPASSGLPKPLGNESIAPVLAVPLPMMQEVPPPVPSVPAVPYESPAAAAAAPGAEQPDRTPVAASASGTRRSTPVDPAAIAAPTAGLQQASTGSASRGTLLVDSEPSGAEVSINGIAHGRTPLLLEALRAGSRIVRVELEGYERWSWSVTIVANRRTPVRVRLQPDRRAADPGF